MKRWTLFTLSSFVLSNLVLVIDIFGWILPQRSLPEAGSVIIITLSNAFLTAMFAGMLMTVSNCELPPHDPTDDAMSDPDDVNIQPGAKRRFTHTGTTEIDQSSPRYSRYSGVEDCKILKQSQIYQASVGGCREVWSTELGAAKDLSWKMQQFDESHVLSEHQLPYLFHSFREHTIYEIL